MPKIIDLKNTFLKTTIVPNLPPPFEADLKTIYRVPKDGASALSTDGLMAAAGAQNNNNGFDEYIFSKHFKLDEGSGDAVLYSIEDTPTDLLWGSPMRLIPGEYIGNEVVTAKLVELEDTNNNRATYYTNYSTGCVLNSVTGTWLYEQLAHKVFVIPYGEWSPLDASDDMYVQHNCKWSLTCRAELYIEYIEPELIGSNVGFAATDGGEIFNDYLTNRALSVNSSVRGTNNTGGITVFNVKDFNTKTKTFTLDKVFGIEVGDVFSVLTDYHSALNIGKVTAIDKTNCTVTVDSKVDASVGVSGTIEHFFIYAKPLIGTTVVGDGCTVEGASNIAIGYYSHVEGRGNTAVDTQSHAEGRNTKSIGNAAHTEGNATQAIGHRSHAEGRNTKAIGDDSHAEGYKTEAKYIAHSEGLETKAYGSHSHTEGAYTSTAQGDAGTCAHAEGLSSQANGAAAHAEGEHTQANAQASHTEGLYTVTQSIGAHAEGTASIVYPTTDYPSSKNLQFRYDSGVGELYILDTDTNSDFWAYLSSRYSIVEDRSERPPSYRFTAPLRVVVGDVVIICSTVRKALNGGPDTLPSRTVFEITDVKGSDIGFLNSSSPFSVTTIYERGEAVGSYSHSENNAYSKGNYSHAENSGISNGQYSHAEGNGVAIGESSHAEGKGVANSKYSHAEGEGQATGQSSHSEGKGTASKMYAHAEGEGQATNQGAHAENAGKAAGWYSHAEGAGTAEGSYNHAEGAGKTESTAQRSHAENSGVAKAIDCHAEGCGTAKHDYSHASGNKTITGRTAQTVVGAFNKEVANAYFVVGDGTSDTTAGRRNAFVVKDNGSATLRTQGTTDDSVVRYALIKEVRTEATTNLDTAKTYTDTSIKALTDKKGVSLFTCTDGNYSGKSFNSKIANYTLVNVYVYDNTINLGVNVLCTVTINSSADSFSIHGADTMCTASSLYPVSVNVFIDGKINSGSYTLKDIMASRVNPVDIEDSINGLLVANQLKITGIL